MPREGGGVAEKTPDSLSRSSETTRVGGVVRRVDELGRIVIPVEIRKRFGIHERDPLEITVQGDAVVLTRPRNACVFCAATENLTSFHDRSVCWPCRLELGGKDVVSA
jgi:AbrB family transcriptional regulator, transcriptional pleiotropic regulator of transition state genes